MTPEGEQRRIGQPIMAELMDPPPVEVSTSDFLIIEASSLRPADLKPLSE